MAEDCAACWAFCAVCAACWAVVAPVWAVVAAVWAAPEIRHARLREQRKFSEDEIRLREARQLPADAKLERADFGVINNDGLAELELQIGRLVRLLNGSVR